MGRYMSDYIPTKMAAEYILNGMPTDFFYGLFARYTYENDRKEPVHDTEGFGFALLMDERLYKELIILIKKALSEYKTYQPKWLIEMSESEDDDITTDLHIDFANSTRYYVSIKYKDSESGQYEFVTADIFIVQDLVLRYALELLDENIIDIEEMGEEMPETIFNVSNNFVNPVPVGCLS